MHPDQHSLELAIAHGDAADVKLLLNSSPDLISIRFEENIGLTPLMWACRNRQTSIVEFLLDRGATVHDRNTQNANGDGGNTALWFTAQGAFPGTVPIAGLLIAHGAEINAQCEHGTTPFYMAVAWVHMELVQFLLEHGADPSVPNATGKTPLQSIQKDYEWLMAQEKRSEDMKRFGFRAPRMIAFLERLNKG